MTTLDEKDIRDALTLYFVAGTVNTSRPLEDVLSEAIAGGVTMFQFREKGPDSLENGEKLLLAEKLKEVCQKHSVPFIVNDDVELALKTDADGVHIGQDDAAPVEVRRKIGPGKILGISAHTVGEAEDAARNGADYIGTGPMFATSSKEDSEPVCGPGRIKEIHEAGVRLPVVGIGGISAANAGEVIAAGADGIAVISAVSSGPSPDKNAALLREKIRLSKK